MVLRLPFRKNILVGKEPAFFFIPQAPLKALHEFPVTEYQGLYEAFIFGNAYQNTLHLPPLEIGNASCRSFILLKSSEKWALALLAGIVSDKSITIFLLSLL